MTLLRHPLALDSWSRRSSPVHRLPAWIKLAATLAALIGISIAPQPLWFALPAAIVIIAAGLPLHSLALRACAVLPFVVVFVVMTWLQGDRTRAELLLTRALLSTLWVVALVATTPLEEILRTLRKLGVPAILLDVVYFLWRYMHVVLEETSRLRTAALARGATRSFRVSASTVASLFLSANARAERIHRAMIARGGNGAWQ